MIYIRFLRDGQLRDAFESIVQLDALIPLSLRWPNPASIGQVNILYHSCYPSGFNEGGMNNWKSMQYYKLQTVYIPSHCAFQFTFY